MDLDAALAVLREARVSLFTACQQRDSMLRRKPVSVVDVNGANRAIEQARANVQSAREAVQSAMSQQE